MLPKQYTFINYSAEQFDEGKEPQRIFANPKNRGKWASHRNVRAMAAGNQDIPIPIGPISVDKEKRGIALPSKFGEVLQPHLSQPPIYLPSAYAMENFEDFCHGCVE
ncbi:hypothetical protein BDD12DRAFT_886166 [Trichophaea hybrida]|nr:hypothetical protein BDD12DRAFT_886166 [Trichophaea hybrida]